MTKRTLLTKIATTILVAFAGLVSVISAASAGVPYDPTGVQSKPKLLVKGASFLVHSVPSRLDGPFGPWVMPDGPLIITYTSLASGDMKILAKSGFYTIPTHQHITSGGFRILGVLHDKDYLFLCKWTINRDSDLQSSFVNDPDTQTNYLQCDKGRLSVELYNIHNGLSGMRLGFYPGSDEQYQSPGGGGLYGSSDGGRLSYFWRIDKYLIADLHKQLTQSNLDSKLPKTVPDETVEAGPLKLVPDGVECYGIVIRYKGHLIEEVSPRPFSFGGGPRTELTAP